MFIRTERLFLRPTFPEDWRAILDVCDVANVLRPTPYEWKPWTIPEAQSLAARSQDPTAPHFLVTVPDRRGADVVGICGLVHLDDEIGFSCWIRRSCRNRGYATEAAVGVLEIAHMIGHSRLVAALVLDDRASAAVLRKVGFQPCSRAKRLPQTAMPASHYVYELTGRTGNSNFTMEAA